GAPGVSLVGYVVLSPRVRVHLLVVLGFWITTIAVPAYLMLFYWLFLQVIGGLPALGDTLPDKGGGAFLAHVGGFVAGAVLIKLFARSDLVLAHRRAIAGQVFSEPFRHGS